MSDHSTLERAFQLAKSGRFSSVADLRRQLKAENYPSVEEHLAGGSIRRQLKDLIVQSKTMNQ